MKNLFLIFLIASLLFCCETEAPEESVIDLKSNDPMIEKFKKQAHDEIDYLIEFMSEHDDDTLYKYAVKSPFSDNDEIEHMWVDVYKYEDKVFYGYLANEPQIVSNIKYGDEVTVNLKDIEDWILDDYLTNTRVGGFSIDYLRDNQQ